jgi:basic membrane protein A and related proteins
VKQRRWGVFFILFAVIALVLAGCGDDDGDDEGGGNTDTTAASGSNGGSGDNSDKKVGMVFDVGGKGDKSFNDSAFEGLTRAADELGVEVRELEPAADGSNREALMRQMAEEGYGLVIGVGFAFSEVMPAIVADFPDTQFAIVDSVVEAENVASLVFAEEEGSFLVGAIAAQKSETGRIGFVGGVETQLIQKFEAGYVAGAKAVNPDITVDVKYITPDGDFSGFADPASGKTVAAGLYSGGADVVYHAAGQSGNGVIEAAVEADKLVIGVDSNQYLSASAEAQPHILSSMLKRVDVAVFDTIETWVNGEFAGGTTEFSLENEGIDFATDGDQIEDVEAIEALKEQIISGEIEVPTTP